MIDHPLGCIYRGGAYLAAQSACSSLERGECLNGAASAIAASLLSAVDAASCVGIAVIKAGSAVFGALPYGLSASKEELWSSVNYLGRATTFARYACAIPSSLINMNATYRALCKLRHYQLQQTLPFTPSLLDERTLPWPLVDPLQAAINREPQFVQMVTPSSLLHPVVRIIDALFRCALMVPLLISASISFVMGVVHIQLVMPDQIGGGFFPATLREAGLLAELDAWAANSPQGREDKLTACERIFEAFQKQSIELDLSNLGLETLPAAVGRLTHLQALYLNDNYLRSLPETVGELTQLHTLHLHENPELLEVPPALERIPGLLYTFERRMHLNARGDQGQDTRLTASQLRFREILPSLHLPAEAAELVAELDRWMVESGSLEDRVTAGRRILEAFRSQSSELDLSGLDLTGLPTTIGQLTHLQVLYLNGNQLECLPAVVGELTQLHTLWLQYNYFTDLPPEIIGRLTKLRTLRIQEDPLAVLPPQSRMRPIDLAPQRNWEEIKAAVANLPQVPAGMEELLAALDSWVANAQPTEERVTAGKRILEAFLSRVDEVNLSSLGLTALPAAIGQLTHLSALYLGGNQLEYLPETIGELTRLRVLWLGHNNLAALSPEIGQLRQLRTLIVCNNPSLSEIPMTLGQIPRLTQLSIEDTLIDARMRDSILNRARQNCEDPGLRFFTEKLQMWRIASRTEIDLSVAREFNSDEKALIDQWLTRLEGTRDFEGGAQVIMARTVCEMLVEAATCREFKRAFLIQVEANNENCADRASMALNELYTFLCLSRLDENAPVKEQLTLLSRAAKTIALRHAVAKTITNQQQEVGMVWHEAVEIYLFCETRLKERLNLLSITSTMLYQQLGSFGWVNLDDLVLQVNDTYLDYLVKHPAFDRLVEKEGEGYKQGHQAEYDAFYQKLENEPENAEEIGQQREALELQHKREWALAVLEG